MSKSSGGVRSPRIGREGFKDSGGTKAFNPRNIGSLKEIKDTKLRREIQQGISKFESRLNLPTTNVYLATLTGALGVHSTVAGESSAVYLSRGWLEKNNVSGVKKTMEDAYKVGHLTRTNKDVQHVIVHELAHGKWNNALKSQKAQQAGVEINNLANRWIKDYRAGKTKGYGSYATTNVNEFYAETMTKAVLGKDDKYTRELVKITKKYKL